MNMRFQREQPSAPTEPAPVLLPWPRVAGWGVLLVLLMLAAVPGAPVRWPDAVVATLPALHFSLEMLAMAASLLVVATCCHTFDTQRPALANSLILVFSMVAVLDFLHALSSIGMAPVGSAEAGFLWLAGRTVELLGLALLRSGVRLPGRHCRWLLLGIAASLPLAWLGLNVPAWQVGAGVGRGWGIVLCIGYLAMAAWMVRARGSERPMSIALAKASLMMGIGGLAYATGNPPTDASLLLGQLCKLLACLHVFAGIYLVLVRRPWQQLLVSRRQLAAREGEYRSLVDNMPIGLMRLDGELRLRFASPTVEQSLGLAQEAMQGKALAEIIPAEVAQKMLPGLQRALQGERVGLDYDFVSPVQGQLYRSFTAVPEYGQDKAIRGVLAIVQDITERTLAEQQMALAMRETGELRAALDAHAIVAMTDRRGVITKVNDKFCEISRYSREELIGSTHQIINSNWHPKSFFKEMWATIGKGNVWDGEICNRAKDGSLYWVQTTIVPLLGEDGRPQQYIAIRADITRRKLAEKEARQLAYHDALTGVGNRRLMMEQLNLAAERARQMDCLGALAMIDLDHFKEINDTQGHPQGDSLLQQVALRLTEAARPDDVVVRLGGDEFCVLFHNLGNTPKEAVANVADIGERMRNALAQPFRLGDTVLNVSSSIGISMIRSGCDAGELIQRADQALYKAKEEGGGAVQFFGQRMQVEMMNRINLLRDLHQAIEGGQLHLYYQPIVDTDMAVTGHEALLRWRHPSRGMVPPDVFIPLAEQVNLILPIGLWVLETACRQIKAWEDDPVRSQWSVSVNVSARQLHDPDFVASVEGVLERTGARPGCLRLELTESMLHTNLEAAIGKMQQLRQRGVCFSLDDFGTGYSSLSYLRQLPVAQLKVDRSFVCDIQSSADDMAIVKMILALASSMGVEVVAEGVESQVQFELLRRYGCQKYQGYLFGRPAELQ